MTGNILREGGERRPTLADLPELQRALAEAQEAAEAAHRNLKLRLAAVSLVLKDLVGQKVIAEGLAHSYYDPKSDQGHRYLDPHKEEPEPVLKAVPRQNLRVLEVTGEGIVVKLEEPISEFSTVIMGFDSFHLSTDDPPPVELDYTLFSGFYKMLRYRL